MNCLNIILLCTTVLVLRVVEQWHGDACPVLLSLHLEIKGKRSTEYTPHTNQIDIHT